MAENIEFRLKVIEDKLGVALEQNEKKAKSLGSALNVAIGAFAAGAAIKGVSLLSDGFRNLNNFVLDSVKAASESQDALNSLNLALSQTGILSEENSKKIQDFASQIQATTAYEDDAVISTAAYIQALGRLDVDGLQRATQSALDLSAALSIDLDSAATIVGKAAEGNTIALQKLGIQFQKGKSDAETFANILTTLESRFGGAAEAQVRTFSGAVSQLSNVFNSLQENIGNTIIKNPAVIAGFKTLNTIIISIADSINTAFGTGNSDSIASLINLIFDISNAVVLLSDAVIRVTSIFYNFGAGVVNTIQGIAAGISALILNVLAEIPLIGQYFQKAADEASATFKSFAVDVTGNLKGIKDALSGESVLSNFSLSIADAKNNFNVFYADIKSKQADLIANNKTPTGGGLDDAEQKRVDALNAQLLESKKNFIVAKAQLDFQDQLDQDARWSAKTASDIQKLTDFELQKSQIQYDSAVKAAAALATQEETAVAKKKALQDKELRDAQIKTKGLADIRKNDLDNQNAFFSAATSLASSKSKELAVIGKAAAITEIAIRTPKAIAQSYEFGTAFGGPVLGAALGAIAGAAMAAQAAKVAGVQGFADGGIIGATNGPDNAIATVRTGEMVLNANQQKNLFDMINSGGVGGDIVVQVDGREIARAVRSQVQQGYKLA